MRKKRKPLRFWIILLLFFGILGWGIFQITDVVWSIFTKDKAAFHKLHTIHYKGDENFFAYPFQTGIAIHDQEKICLYDGKGQEKWAITKKINQLIATGAKDILFCGDKNTGEITAIHSKGKILWSIDLRASFIKLKSNEAGYLAAHIKDSQNKEKIVIVNPKGKIEGEILLTRGEILDFVISEKEIIGVSAMNTENNAIHSHIVFYSTKGKLLGGNKGSEEIISNVFFDSKGRLLSIGTGNLNSFDREGGLLWSKEVPDTIRRVVWNPQGWTAINLSDYKNTILDPKNQNYIWFVNSSGEEIGKTAVQGNVLGLHSRGNDLAAFTERTVYVFTQNGKLVAEKKISNDIQAVYLLPQNRLVLVFKNKAEIFEWKHRK